MSVGGALKVDPDLPNYSLGAILSLLAVTYLTAANEIRIKMQKDTKIHVVIMVKSSCREMTMLQCWSYNKHDSGTCN